MVRFRLCTEDTGVFINPEYKVPRVGSLPAATRPNKIGSQDFDRNRPPLRAACPYLSGIFLRF
jgi:hypothetical protein